MKNKLNNILIERKQLIKNIFIISILAFIFIIIITAFLGKQDRIGYLSEFNLISSKKGEYTYNFRIKYYSKIFRNSDIYDVYPYLNNLPKYIKSAKMNDRFGTPFGSLISTKELKPDDKIDTKYYLMINFDVFYYIVIVIIIILIFTGYYFLKEYWKYKYTLDKKDHLFVKKIELVGILLFAFQYWLFYPGYFQNFDTWRSIVHGLYNMSHNWDPVLLDLSIKFIDKIGLTMSSFFFINLFLWYCSISVIIISIYIKTKNKLSILLFLISFIPQIFLFNIEYLKDSVATLYIIFSYSIVFFIIVSPLKNRNKRILKIISLLSLIIGMLHRHNFIVTVYPILIWFTYDYLKTKDIKSIKKYIFYFIGIMLINAVVLMSVYFIFPKIFIKNINKTASLHIYNLQIAGCIVPANDPSLIPESWWGEGKSFKDLAEQYNKNPFLGDPIRNDKIFLSPAPSEVKIILLKSILKYPQNYIKHMFNFTKAMWTSKYQYYQYEGRYPNNTVLKTRKVDKIFKNTKFYKENQGIKFTELKKSIFNFLTIILPNINVFFFILISVILFCISGILLILKKEFINDVLVFTFSVSFSSIATASIVALFTAAIDYNYRYIYTIIPISILALIGFITFIYEIGGFKKFIKELRGDEK